MTTKVTDEVLGKTARQLVDWFERIRKGSLNPEELYQVVKPLLEKGKWGEFFISPSDQLALVRQRNKERGWGFTEDDFTSLREDVPAWPEEKLCAVVLDVSLDTIQRTFEQGWHFTAKAQEELGAGKWRWDEIKSDSKHLRFLQGIEFQPNTLQWRVVDLGANWDKKNGIRPKDVRNPKNSPHSAILWAASYFPKWIQAMDGVNIPYVWIPGYELTIPVYGPWSNVPCLFWHRGTRKVRLYARSSGNADPFWAVPRLWE